MPTFDPEALRRPFKAGEIEWRISRSGLANQKIWARCLAYVTARAVMARLDEVCGVAGWRVSYHTLGGAGTEAGIIARLELKIDGEWIAKEDGADQSDTEAFKGGLSGALKRAAVAFGLGRYLYDLEETFATIVEKGTRDAHYQPAPKSKETPAFYWTPPALPEWALPPGPAKSEPPKKEAPKGPDPKPAPASIPAASAPPVVPKSSPAVPSTPVAASTTSAPPRKLDKTSELLSKKIIELYQPFLHRHPDTNFVVLLKQRYGVEETRLMTAPQMSDLITYMEECMTGPTGKPLRQGKPPTDSERRDLWNASKKNGWTAEQMSQYLRTAFGVESSQKLTREQFQLASGVTPNVAFTVAMAEFEGMNNEDPIP